MERIAIFGPAGSGKSSLARELAEALDLPVVHLDRLFWRAGWVPAPHDEWQAIQRRESEFDSWIADGLQEERTWPELWLESADMLVFLDVSPLASVWRIARRRLESTPGPEIPEDCEPAPFYRAFPKVVRFLLLYRKNVRRRVLAELERRKDSQQVAVLRSGGDVRRFVADAKAQRGALGESLLT